MNDDVLQPSHLTDPEYLPRHRMRVIQHGDGMEGGRL